MSDPQYRPSLRDRLRPLELLGISAGCAVFAGIVTLIALHPWGDYADQAPQSWLIVLIVTGAVFVIALVVLAMLLLAVQPAVTEPPRDEEPQGPAH